MVRVDVAWSWRNHALLRSGSLVERNCGAGKAMRLRSPAIASGRKASRLLLSFRVASGTEANEKSAADGWYRRPTRLATGVSTGVALSQCLLSRERFSHLIKEGHRIGCANRSPWKLVPLEKNFPSTYWMMQWTDIKRVLSRMGPFQVPLPPCLHAST